MLRPSALSSLRRLAWGPSPSASPGPSGGADDATIDNDPSFGLIPVSHSPGGGATAPQINGNGPRWLGGGAANRPASAALVGDDADSRRTLDRLGITPGFRIGGGARRTLSGDNGAGYLLGVRRGGGDAKGGGAMGGAAATSSASPFGQSDLLAVLNISPGFRKRKLPQAAAQLAEAGAGQVRDGGAGAGAGAGQVRDGGGTPAVLVAAQKKDQPEETAVSEARAEAPAATAAAKARTATPTGHADATDSLAHSSSSSSSSSSSGSAASSSSVSSSASSSSSSSYAYSEEAATAREALAHALERSEGGAGGSAASPGVAPPRSDAEFNLEEQPIGRGGFGTVFRGENIVDKKVSGWGVYCYDF